MSVHQDIKKRFVSAIEELSWVTEGGDEHDLRDACYVAREVLAAGLDHIKRMEGTNKGTCAMYDAMIVDQADKIKRLEAEIPRWISVEERLPEDYISVIGYLPIESKNGFPPTREVCHTECGWYAPIIHGLCIVTHWMPLPEPPKEE